MPLAQAAGRWLAEPLAALRDQPWADLSAMDGYAVRHADLPGPWRLAGESAAGSPPGASPLAPGTAMRIFTGAPLPPGADTVVMQEDVTAAAGDLRLTGPGPDARGRHVRPRASEFRTGTVLLPAGIRLGPAQIALAAVAGHGMVAVHAAPRVALLSTGSELVAPGAPCPPGKLPASNSAMLRAMIGTAGGIVSTEQLLPDDLPTIIAALHAAQDADVIVTSGGTAAGDHDLVRPAIAAAGGRIDIWRIAMRPGKPMVVGRLGDAMVIGLPGTPGAALTSGALFLLPLLRRLAGAARPLPAARTARLGADLPAPGPRTDFVHAVLAGDVAQPLADRGQAALADAFIVRPADAPAARAGDPVPVLDWPSLGLAG
jgi:molybdopterin molybdotransferase